MGLEVLVWIWVLTWMAKTAATDVLHAVKGTPNPRYELKKQRAAAAGRPVSGQPRYGTREWLGDLYSDALAAHTEKRRKAAKAKAAPVDDMVDVVREPVPAEDRRDVERIVAQAEEEERREAEWKKNMRPVGEDEIPKCVRCRVEEAQPGSARCPRCDREVERLGQPAVLPDQRPLAPVIQMFPNVKQIEKEITMANSEVTGLSTARAFAEAAASAHQSFATGGAEGYVGALESGGMSGPAVASAREAMEASGIAAAKWDAHRSELERQMTVKEAYQGQPDAAHKEFLLAE